MKVYWSGTEAGLRYEILKEQSGGDVSTLPGEDIFNRQWPQDGSVILLHPELYHHDRSHLPFEPALVHRLDFFDGFINRNHKWAPDCSYPTVFQNLLAQKNTFLDTSGSCLVVGDLLESRAALTELFRMGFRSMRVLREAETPPFWIENQIPHFFGLKVEVVDPKDLVQMSGECSVLVYGVCEIQFEHELSYLNFLSRPGLILDFYDSSFLLKVLQDTQEETLSYIGAREIETASLKFWQSV